MANLKNIRKRIVSVKSTQKITRAMKMVAAAQLNRAQQRIIAVRPYALKTAQVLSEVVATSSARQAQHSEGGHAEVLHPLLAHRPEQRALVLVVSGDRGLAGAFNSNVLRLAERVWKEREAQGQKVQFAVIGRKGRDYLRRRGAPVFHYFPNIWERLDLEQARGIARALLTPFARGEVDAIYLVYNEFKSAVSQRPAMELLFPLASSNGADAGDEGKEEWAQHREFMFEPDQSALLERLVPMYVEISILRALLESRASEFGAQMTAMDAATKNASEMIAKLTLDYNRARQAAITTELMEIIGGAEALRNG